MGSIRKLSATVAVALIIASMAGCFSISQRGTDTAVGAGVVAAADAALTGGSALDPVNDVPSLPVRKARRADFLNEQPSSDSRYIADWVVDSGDNQGMPFIIINKVDAMAFLFDTRGQLRGAAPVLLGAAVGDDSAANIGTRRLANIRPDERTTPACRFEASLAKNLHGKEILWVDYKANIALYSVVTSNPKERRLQRLATETPLDNRISYGCINVPAAFFKDLVRPTFTGTNSIVYVLPETRPVRKAFGSYDVLARDG